VVIGFWFGNLLFYVTGVVLLVRAGAAIARVLELDVATVRTMLIVGAIVFAPAVASLVHIPILVPFTAYPFFHANARWLLPWNAGFAVLTSIVAVMIYNRRIAAPRSPNG
jgi:low affinity Fe/Cu permease